MDLTIIGLAMIACGAVYILKPALFRRGMWMKTSVAIRTLSEQGYKRYIQGMGAVFILIGVGCIAWGHGLAGVFERFAT